MLLILDNRRLTVRHDRDTLLLEAPDQPQRRIPVNLLDQVIVHGNPHIEVGVWRLLASRNVPALLLPVRGRQEPAILATGLATALPLRRLQHRCADRPAARRHIAAWLLRAKLEGYGLPLAAWPEAVRADCESQRRQALERLDQATDPTALLGIEGAFANAWFGLLARQLPAAWRFTGRNRRPPRDPVNALLSLGYTLLGAEVRHVLLGEGLDPALGFLHEDHPGRDSLVLDLVEPFRGGVDRFVLELLTHLRPDDFSHSQADGCRLRKAARQTFYDHWAERRENWPRAAASGEVLSLSPLREQIRGRAMALREQLKQACPDDDHG